jgi:hypothetical protein
VANFYENIKYVILNKTGEVDRGVGGGFYGGRQLKAYKAWN